LLSAIFSNDVSQIERTASASAQQAAVISTRVHPLLFAALLGNAEGVEALLRAGVKQSEVHDGIGLCAIHYAAGNLLTHLFILFYLWLIFSQTASGCLEAVRALVRNDSRAAEDANNANKLTPLHLALYYGRKDTAQFLIDKIGPSRMNSVDSRNRSNIFYAALGKFLIL
jgi:ankyrin repeat protein